MTREEKEQFAKDNVNLIYAFLDHYHLRHKEEEILDILFIGYTYAIDHYDSSRGTFGNFAYHCLLNEYCKYLRVSKYPKRNTSGYIFVPLQSKVDEGDDTTFEDILADPNVNVEEEVLQKVYDEDTFANVVEAANFACYGGKSLLTKREKLIFNYMYLSKLNMVDIAKKVGVSKQAINQSQKKIINKLTSWFMRHDNNYRKDKLELDGIGFNIEEEKK